MKSKETYMFSFFKTDDITGVKIVPYTFYIMEDGTIIFTHKGVDSLQEEPLVTTEEHQELLNRIKENLEIEF
ncbi:hypothetical protein FGG79_14195 [Bacillus sp. BHET2]|nr:hypothetical protein FGG79_14195 [Bacillus sp. BHET2]